MPARPTQPFAMAAIPVLEPSQHWMTKPPHGRAPAELSVAADVEPSRRSLTVGAHDGCNRLLTCSIDDPTQRPGGCPISRAVAKQDIRYLGEAELHARYAELRELRLATYRYRDAGPGSPERLGFIIDDGPPAVCVGGRGDSVDLYGYASLTVAAVQVQARRIEQLERKLAELRERLDKQAKGSGEEELGRGVSGPTTGAPAGRRSP